MDSAVIPADVAVGQEDSSSWDSRTLRLIGEERVARLAAARVLVVGTGGVGGYAAEMLARSGVGHLTLVDADTVAESNINRQIIALRSTVGKSKTALFKERFLDINPDVEVNAIERFVTPDNVAGLIARGFDFVVDAIDTVAPKVALIAECLKTRTPLISSMGAGGRVDPTKIGYFDLWETREDGLARAVRQRLKKMGIRSKVMTVASTEAPRSCSLVAVNGINKLTSYGTLATIPSIFGIMMANYVILKLVSH